MFDVVTESHGDLPVGRREMEYVERKGLGHPDTVCDAVMESISVELCRTYRSAAGRVLHHNIDKGLLVAGQTSPKLGGGEVVAPMKLVVGDRATGVFAGKTIPVAEIAEATARRWFGKHLRFVRPQHVIVQNELRAGSAELMGIVNAGTATAGSHTTWYAANDTSVGVGFAPFTETEHLVLAAEHFLNSPEFKHEFPETGEDVKVMGVRRGRRLQLTVAVAFVDRFIWEVETYFHRKAAVERRLQAHLQTKLIELDEVDIQVNALDDTSRGIDGTYLTVLGTSAEAGDGGQVGRGNRVNGLISFCRPMTLEAAAGKNPASHVGKVYNLLAREIAESIHDSVDGVDEVYVWLCSRIGHPLDEPWFASTRVALADGAAISDVREPIADIVRREVADVGSWTARLSRGELHIC